ncbi:MAG: hypothetical protein F4X40_10255 [Chloroflexi bacterium]|nr:hypothetical protein [Chloroflexota bacterium]
MWAGCDPGGKDRFGVATVDGSGNTRCATVSSVDQAASWINASGTTIGLGIDAPMWWSACAGGGRKADARLRRAYGIASGTVQSVNSLQGAVLVGGLLLASQMRVTVPGVPITEAHPKALLLALGLDGASFARRFGIRQAWSDDHQRDAAIAAVCAREGFSRNWTVDLATDRHELEQDPHSYWLAPVFYFWPESIP